jgi:hypothetical protein
MPVSKNTLGWYVVGRRIMLCLGLALFFGGWAGVSGASDDLSVPTGAFLLGFFVPLRELRIGRDPETRQERII